MCFWNQKKLHNLIKTGLNKKILELNQAFNLEGKEEKRRWFAIHELLWSFFLFLLLPVELRGLVGVMGRTGQGSVLLPWLLKPEVAVEEGEKPPLTRAERKHVSKGWYSKL